MSALTAVNLLLCSSRASQLARWENAPGLISLMLLWSISTAVAPAGISGTSSSPLYGLKKRNAQVPVSKAVIRSIVSVGKRQQSSATKFSNLQFQLQTQQTQFQDAEWNEGNHNNNRRKSIDMFFLMCFWRAKVTICQKWCPFCAQQRPRMTQICPRLSQTCWYSIDITVVFLSLSPKLLNKSNHTVSVSQINLLKIFHTTWFHLVGCLVCCKLSIINAINKFEKILA